MTRRGAQNRLTVRPRSSMVSTNVLALLFYRVTSRLSFPPLSRHAAAARVTYRRSGHTHTTTVGRMIVMCPA